MQHQIDTNEIGEPIYINLEFSNGSLLIKDHNNSIIKRTIGNPTKPGFPNNEMFLDINEAYQWFLTTSLSERRDTLIEGEEQ